MLRALAISIAACLAAPLALPAQATIAGVLQQQRGSARTPVPDCTVYASSSEAGPLVGEFSDANGRFLLAFPPDSRVSLGADCPGYRLTSIDGRRSPVAVFDCSQPGACADVTLILEPLAVIEGHVLDPNGMPVESIRVVLRKAGGDARSRQYSASSDDRGYFRLFHIPPGDYVLAPHFFSGNAEGVEWRAEDKPLPIAPGDVIAGIQVQLSLAQGIEISGRIEGLPEGAKRLHLTLMNITNTGARFFSQDVQVDAEGRFKLTGVQPGRYYANMILPSAPDASGQTYLGAVEVTPGGELILSPREATLVRVQLQVEWPQRKDLRGLTKGAPLRFMTTSADGIRRPVSAQPPDYGFEIKALPPGRYQLSVFGPGARLDRRVGEDQWKPLGEISIDEGETLDLDLRLSFDVGRLSVLVKPAPGAPQQRAANFVVGIRKNGSARLYATDQNGRLTLRQFSGGDYEICAWPDIGLDEVRDPATWLKAGDAVRKFRHEEGVDMEIGLTAAP